MHIQMHSLIEFESFHFFDPPHKITAFRLLSLPLEGTTTLFQLQLKTVKQQPLPHFKKAGTSIDPNALYIL